MSKKETRNKKHVLAFLLGEGRLEEGRQCLHPVYDFFDSSDLIKSPENLIKTHKVSSILV